MDFYELASLAVSEARKSRLEVGKPALFVGAVAARDGELIASAHRSERKLGDHAEFTLLELKLKNEILAGTTIYTTLEPCVKRGPKKIPCAKRLIERRVAKVVIGTLDPNPEIRGKGMLDLREAGIAVDMFPVDLMAKLEELNRDFFRFQRSDSILPAVTGELTKTLAARSLDEWYRNINSTYFHRNFDRRPADVCLHLIEVIGALSLLASDKTKPGIDKEAQVPKALAWWFSLCGKLGVRSVEAMLWDKFPGHCPYCQLPHHEPDRCTEMKAASPGPRWASLATLGSVGDRPKTVSEWQLMFNKIYPVNQGDQFGPAFARLYEELAELSEAVRVFSSVPGYFLSEASDVFAWLMKIQNLIDDKAGRIGAQRGFYIGQRLAKAYPNACRDCGRAICSCPPILASTVGRIAHEVPSKLGSYEPIGRFMTPDRAAEAFGPALREEYNSD